MGREIVDREIRPQSLREFYIQARQHTFAAGVTPVDGPLIYGSKELRFDNGVYYYYDRYFDSSQRRGRFAGFEIITNPDYVEPEAVYTYGGGLNELGLKLGEKVVYARLQKFLQKNAQTARFGGKVRDLFKDQVGIWIYESNGMVTRWGWADVEYVNLDGDLVYELQGQGICLAPGF